ncbi:thiamine-phosphate kinase [Methanimicrococcus hongohii]|uniref:thiamine-phosphate kinase n=1 Tax=Methanimicrococcus hongohii TaxID=3028295 RepID=UPI002930F13D|nr:AIR synthase related protein [Methanimicrococcus sp. Hf6]
MSDLPTEKDFIRVFSDVFRLKNKPILSGSEFDDCAALRLDSFAQNLSAESLTFSTDSVRESTDFPSGMTLWQKGWMAAAVNLSDLAAMGSKPIAFLFSAGLPRGFTLENAEELARGIQECVSFFGAEVIGGDTEFNDELTITGTVIGITENKNLILRKNARPGDLLCATGFPGSAGVALSVLLNEINIRVEAGESVSDSTADSTADSTSDSTAVSNSISDSGLDSISVSDSFLKNLTEPFPRIFEGMMLAKSGAVNSMIDTSDGLASSVYELSALSGVFFEIDEQSLPQDGEALEILSNHLKNNQYKQNDQNETNFTDEQIAAQARDLLIHEALYTGGDYELLFTIPAGKLSLVEELFKKFNENAISDAISDTASRFEGLSSTGKSGRYPCKFTVIGKAIAEKENVIVRQAGLNSQRQPLLKIGYDSFKKYI